MADVRAHAGSWSFAHLGFGALAGVAVALSGEPWSLNAAAFVSVALFAQGLACSERAPRHLLRALLTGLTFGTLANAIALFSLISLLEDFGHFPAALAWLTAALGWVGQAAPYAVAGLVTEACLRKGVPRWLALPPALAASLGLVPQLFPWHLGATQIDFLPFVQIADLGGEPLLDLCVAFVGTGLYQLVRGEPSSRRRAAVVAAGFLIVPCAYGLVRLDAVQKARAAAATLRVGAVQGNAGIRMKHEPGRAAQILSELRGATSELERRGAELTIWAETAYPYPIGRTRSHEPGGRRRILGDDLRGPVLFGTVTYAFVSFDEHRYNSAWLLRRDGTLADRVDKARLLAFGEYVPFWELLPPLQKRFRSRGFYAGENDVIRTDKGPLGILICYEDLFFALSRKVVERGARALVNMTNDAWFGDSHEPALHDMVARLRAVETRRDFVRVVNTGVSSFTAATGELIARTDTFTKASFIADVKLLDERSPYVRLGDWVSPLCVFGLLGGVLMRRLRKPCARESSGGS